MQPTGYQLQHILQVLEHHSTKVKARMAYLVRGNARIQNILRSSTARKNKKYIYRKNKPHFTAPLHLAPQSPNS